MKEEVLNFINVFTSASNNQDIIKLFDDKCSYWFANILFRRFIFQKAEIMCDIQRNHFGVRINGRVYDIRGDVTCWYSWSEWNYIDEVTKSKLSKEYIMF